MKYLGYVMELVVVLVACMWIHHASLERQSLTHNRQLIEFDLQQNQIQWEPRGGMPTQYQPLPQVIHAQPQYRDYKY